MADGSQDGILFINLAGIGIVRYDLSTFSYTPTGVPMSGTAFTNGGNGYFYTNGPAAAANQLYRLLPEDPSFATRLVGGGARAIEDLATDPGGTMYGVGEGWIFLIDKLTGEQTDLAPLGFEPHGLGFDDDGSLLMDNGNFLMRWNGPGPPTVVAELPWGVIDLASVAGFAGGPPPGVPDGTFGAPMRARRAPPAGSAAIEVQWDAGSCPASGYHLIFGALTGLSSYAVAGAECALGTSGSHIWNSVPAGNTWFLVVGDNGTDLEGTWGKDGSGAHRAGTTTSSQCGMIARVNATACAP